MPHYRIHQDEKDPHNTEPVVEQLFVEAGMGALQQQNAELEQAAAGREYRALVADPRLLTPEGLKMRQEELERLQALQDEKAAVQNIRTGHSDMVRIENGAGEGQIVPAAIGYTQPQIEEGTGRPSRSPLGGIAGSRRGYDELDMAITSIMQPKGDEYSQFSSRGPDHRFGPGFAQVEDGEVQDGDEPPFELDTSVGDAVDQTEENAKEAGEAGAKAAEERAQEQEETAGPQGEQAQERLSQQREAETGTAKTPPTSNAKASAKAKSGSKSGSKSSSGK